MHPPWSELYSKVRFEGEKIKGYCCYGLCLNFIGQSNTHFLSDQWHFCWRKLIKQRRLKERTRDNQDHDQDLPGFQRPGYSLGDRRSRVWRWRRWSRWDGDRTSGRSSAGSGTWSIERDPTGNVRIPAKVSGDSAGLSTCSIIVVGIKIYIFTF